MQRGCSHEYAEHYNAPSSLVTTMEGMRSQCEGARYGTSAKKAAHPKGWPEIAKICLKGNPSWCASGLGQIDNAILPTRPARMRTPLRRWLSPSSARNRRPKPMSAASVTAI